MLNRSKSDVCIFLVILFLSVLLRVLLFYNHYGNLRHGSSLQYGSAAIGLFFSQGLNYTNFEMNQIKQKKSNYSGNYLIFFAPENRKDLTEFLPGPSILLSWLWKVFRVYNFSPYIWMQIVLESILISLFYIVFVRDSRLVITITSILMMANPVSIKYTLTMGYDFWPLFCVLVNFIGLSVALRIKKSGTILLTVGILTGVTVWFRSITTFLPFFTAIFLCIRWRIKEEENYRKIFMNIALYLTPVLILLVLLSAYRYTETGSYRPTRSTFWHSFWAGVGQFSNPYNLESVDQAIWDFGRKLNPQLENYSNLELASMGAIPNSPYEKTLRAEASQFFRKHPFLLIRNTLYRIAIMIAPVFYKDGTFISKGLSSQLYPIGVILIIIWLSGMYCLFLHNSDLFWLCLTTYSYFFSTIAVFYVVGRAILPFLFINMIIYFFGIKSIIQIVKSKLQPCSNSLPIM